MKRFPRRTFSNMQLMKPALVPIAICVGFFISVCASAQGGAGALADEKVEADAAALDRRALTHEAQIVERLAARYKDLAGSVEDAKRLIHELNTGTRPKHATQGLSYGTIYKVLVAATDDLHRKRLAPPVP